MRRITLAVIPLLFVFGATAATTTITSASHGKCKGHGYSHGHCHQVNPGQPGSTTAPNAPVTITFNNPYNFPIDIQSVAVATPAGAPSSSACFSAQVFNHDTGQELTGSLQAPLVFQTSTIIYAYDSATGTFTPLSGNESFSGGIFCSVSGSPGIGLPGTGGAA